MQVAESHRQVQGRAEFTMPRRRDTMDAKHFPSSAPILGSTRPRPRALLAGAVSQLHRLAPTAPTATCSTMVRCADTPVGAERPHLSTLSRPRSPRPDPMALARSKRLAGRQSGNSRQNDIFRPSERRLCAAMAASWRPDKGLPATHRPGEVADWMLGRGEAVWRPQ